MTECLMVVPARTTQPSPRMLLLTCRKPGVRPLRTRRREKVTGDVLPMRSSRPRSSLCASFNITVRQQACRK